MSLKESVIHWFLIGATRKDGIRRKIVMWITQREVDKLMDGKSYLKSKTLWFNVLSGIVGIAISVQSDGNLPANAEKIIGAIVLGGNFILRFLTDKPIQTK